MKPSAKSSKVDRIGGILRALRTSYPEARCALVHSSALELMVATILSAQCTDNRVNIVTRELFRKYRAAKDYAQADPRVFESEVRSTGFYRNKTKSILGAAKLLVEKHGGEVPGAMADLVELPGVARKTANVILGTWFREAAGVVVDTHVRRVSRRLKLTEHDDPEKIERDLTEILHRKEWIGFSHRVIWHGRKVCHARKPRCGECAMASLCPSAGRV